jgi:hypothetical protein
VSSSESTGIICGPDGNPFSTGADNEEYISDFYANLYKKPPLEKNTTVNDINDFLGEITDNMVLSASKMVLAADSNLRTL